MKNANYFIIGIIITLVISFEARNDQLGGATIAKAGMSPTEINLADQLTTLKWISGGMKKVWWYAEYENGMIVYSYPQNYRSALEVATYYLGGGGNWEAFYFDDDGQKKNLCYQDVECAAFYIYQWGAITDLGYRGEDGQWVSLREKS